MIEQVCRDFSRKMDDSRLWQGLVNQRKMGVLILCVVVSTWGWGAVDVLDRGDHLMLFIIQYS